MYPGRIFLNYTGKVELQKSMTPIEKLLDTTLFNFKDEIEKKEVKVLREISHEISEIYIMELVLALPLFIVL